MMEDRIVPDAEEAQVRVTFTTSDESIQLPELKRQLLVPAGEQRPRKLQCESED
jgi:hypothetical protein